MRITIENAASFIGETVEFNYGAMHGTERATIIGYRTTQFGTELEAKTEDGATKYVSNFTNVGIGCYLLENNSEPNKNSPWHVDGNS